MTTVVVGLGVTGQAVARALQTRGEPVVVVADRIDDEALQAAERIGVELRTMPEGLSLVELVAGADRVVPSPGVPIGHALLVAASERGVPIESELELGYQLMVSEARSRPLLVAVTGTNGKTSVVTTLTDVFRRSGRQAVAAGNIGLPLVAMADGGEWPDTVVAEVSSFQLQFTRTFHPDVSCWLNFAPDHLDWHPSVEHYHAAKCRIWANQIADDSAVVNADDVEVMGAVTTVPDGVDIVTFSRKTAATWAERDGKIMGPAGFPFFELSDLSRHLPHDRANALAVAATATTAGADPDALRDGLRHARPLPHRVELVGRSDGVSWYDDSKATTPASVLAAVAGFESVVLIAGGRNKGLDLRSLGDAVPPIRAVVAIGEATSEVIDAFRGAVETVPAESMAEAVEIAGRMARAGDAVILSPGGASYDWYRSYAERGDHFAALVRLWLDKGRPSC